MKEFNWNPDKNHQLIEERNLSFEDVIFHLQNGGLLDDIPHPNKDKYPNQRIFVVSIEEYVHLIPYIENETEFFLKTIIPSRTNRSERAGTTQAIDLVKKGTT